MRCVIKSVSRFINIYLSTLQPSLCATNRKSIKESEQSSIILFHNRNNVKTKLLVWSSNLYYGLNSDVRKMLDKFANPALESKINEPLCQNTETESKNKIAR